MERRKAYLDYRRLQATKNLSEGTLITLHGAGGTLDDTIPFANAVAENHTIVAPRGFWGVHSGPDVIGSTWYRYWTLTKPEPSTFGYSLIELERFILDELDRRPAGDARLPVLMGYEQGAIMALAAASVFQSLLSGVVAICGCMPQVHGWEPPTLTDESLPVLLINDASVEGITLSMISHTTTYFSNQGIRVEQHTIAAASELGDPVQRIVRSWLSDSTRRIERT